MKRSKFTSFLFTIALSLFAFNFTSAQTSADCQDNVNFSVGEACSVAIPWEAFNTWQPSCMLIKDANHNVMAAIVGSGTGITAPTKFNCAVEVDSVWFESIYQDKLVENSLQGWFSCGTGIYVLAYDAEHLPSAPDGLECSRVVEYRAPGTDVWVAAPGLITINSIDDVPDCPHDNAVVNQDVEVRVVDKTVVRTLKTHVTKVMRSDMFSHTEGLSWVRGTQMINATGLYFLDRGNGWYQNIRGRLGNNPTVAGGDVFLVHGASYSNGQKHVYTCPKADNSMAGTVMSNKLGSYVLGAKALIPGTYKYESYSQDGTNACWGNFNVEYKLWPSTPGRSDTISCVDLSDYDRAGDYDYTPTTAKKLEDVCAWAENITRPTGNTIIDQFYLGNFGAGALRTAAHVQSAVNASVRHCYAHTVTSKDEYIRNYDWLCDTMMKVRTFYVDHPGSGGKVSIKELAKDSLYVTPIEFDEVQFPDSSIVLKCGILEEYGPKHIAEYLYHAFDHSGTTPVIVDYDKDGAKYVKGDPCALFGAQYAPHAYNGGPSAWLSWKKIFEVASYNNYGVEQAYPYVVRRTKAIDGGVKYKLLGHTSYFNSKAAAAIDSVLIPVNKVVCNIAATKIDLHPVEICPGDYKFFRTWTLLDWCTGTTKEQTQVIKVVDLDAPAIVAINGLSPNPAGDADDDNSKGREDHYFGDNGRDNTDSAEDGPGGSNHPYDYNTHYIKVTNPWGCYASYTLPTLSLREHCSTPGYHYKINGVTYQAGDVANIAWSHGAPKTRVDVYLWDECDNDTETHWFVDVHDKIPPVVVLHDELIVTLTANNEDFVGSVEHGPQGTPGEGIAKIYCDMVDAGSHDGDCGTVTCTGIRRKGDAAFNEFVHFTCADIGQVEVEVQIADWSGNTSIGWMTITVEQKGGPYITCEDVVIECDDNIHPDWIGYPHAYAICDAPAIEYSDDYNVDDLCYKGYIDRTWTITGTTTSCVQRITITSDDKDGGSDESTFNPTSIHWPLHNNGKTLAETNYPAAWTFIYTRDAHGNCISGNASDFGVSQGELSNDGEFECEQGDTKEPTWTDPDCGLVGKTFEDQHVKFNDGVCFKVLRTWTVIDWCVYDAKKGDYLPNENEYVLDLCFAGKPFYRVHEDAQHDIRDGYYTFTQEILVVDKTQPEFTEDKQKIEVEVGAGSKTDDSDCSGAVTLTRSATDYCLASQVEGEEGTKEEGPEIDWYIKLFRVNKETGAETQVRLPGVGTGWFSIAEGGNEVGHETLYSHENAFGSASVTIGGASHEVYHVKWRIEDGCNNPNEILDVVEFVDVKAPVLICYADLSTNAMSTDGTSEIWANDYAHAYDCDGEEVDVWFKDDAGNLVPALYFDCSVLGGNTAATWEGRVYAVDAKGNESFCEVTLRIVDSNGACMSDNSGAALIAGEVVTELGDMVESARVSMDDKSMMTSTDGQFAFDNNAMGLNYSLEASKNDDHLNGVSTLDLVLIQKHILGLETLDSQFKVIAADINNDDNVSAIDLVELRKVILGISNEFTNNTSWRFGDASQSTFVEAMNIDFLTEDTRNDFIAVKVGDVSGNAIANSLITDGRSNATIALSATDREVKAGESVSVSISSAEFVAMNALQFTLNTSGLEYTGVRSGALEMGDNNVAVFGNGITAAWSDVNAVTSSDELFTLEFTALTDIALSNAISMTSSITSARAYNSDLERFDTELVFNSEDGSTIGAAFELMQNTPNPFQNTTSIGFNLGEAGTATLTVFDVTGKTVMVNTATYDRGYNEITVNKSQLGTSGVLYYQLESGDFTATRKMIVID